MRLRLSVARTVIVVPLVTVSVPSERSSSLVATTDCCCWRRSRLLASCSDPARAFSTRWDWLTASSCWVPSVAVSPTETTMIENVSVKPMRFRTARSSIPVMSPP
ncbi:hypothetical protein BRC78_03860 [Halobacteriales archaeon QH_8_68_33]|nr:MAG: hypothetical protein BRC78_03860 [Halobacteriales archaeon QH_8_68_33]